MSTVGIYALDDSAAPIYAITVCLDWRLPDGCPHTTDEDKAANHIVRPFNTRGHSAANELDRIADQALAAGVVEALRRLTPQASLVGRYLVVTP